MLPAYADGQTPTQIMARAVALTNTGWSGYVRAANPGARREAPTSGPVLLATVGRAANRGGQTTRYLTPMHAQVGLIKSMIANVHAAVAHVRRTAAPLPGPDRWRTLLDYIGRRILGPSTLPNPPPALARSG